MLRIHNDDFYQEDRIYVSDTEGAYKNHDGEYVDVRYYTHIYLSCFKEEPPKWLFGKGFECVEIAKNLADFYGIPFKANCFYEKDKLDKLLKK